MIWFPYTQMKTMKEPLTVVDAKGVYLYTEDNHKLIDTTASWWSKIHGYNNPHMNQAIIDQVNKFSHVMLGGIKHKPVMELSKKLESMLPGTLNNTFFSDSGSVAVEIAIKMAIQFFINKKKPRNKIMSLKNSYHGDTFKAMEIGDDGDYHNIFSGGQNTVLTDTTIEDLEINFKNHGDSLAAFIVEPLLQGAGGMKVYDVSFLKRARELCGEYEVIFIYDEIATGFGRTGNRFVSDLVEPDIVCLGKALTGGYLGHAVTVANDKVFEGFYGDDQDLAFMHGPTFMANALTCAAALKSIELFEQNDYLGKIKNIQTIAKRELSDLCDDRIADIRILGGMFCIEVKEEETLKGFSEFAYEKEVYSRPFLKYLYATPPYIITEDELVHIINVYKEWFSKK